MLLDNLENFRDLFDIYKTTNFNFNSRSKIKTIISHKEIFDSERQNKLKLTDKTNVQCTKILYKKIKQCAN